MQGRGRRIAGGPGRISGVVTSVRRDGGTGGGERAVTPPMRVGGQTGGKAEGAGGALRRGNGRACRQGALSGV